MRRRISFSFCLSFFNILSRPIAGSTTTKELEQAVSGPELLGIPTHWRHPKIRSGPQFECATTWRQQQVHQENDHWRSSRWPTPLRFDSWHFDDCVRLRVAIRTITSHSPVRNAIRQTKQLLKMKWLLFALLCTLCHNCALAAKKPSLSRPVCGKAGGYTFSAVLPKPAELTFCQQYRQQTCAYRVVRMSPSSCVWHLQAATSRTRCKSREKCPRSSSPARSRRLASAPRPLFFAILATLSSGRASTEEFARYLQCIVGAESSVTRCRFAEPVRRVVRCVPQRPVHVVFIERSHRSLPRFVVRVLAAPHRRAIVGRRYPLPTRFHAALPLFSGAQMCERMGLPLWNPPVVSPVSAYLSGPNCQATCRSSHCCSQAKSLSLSLPALTPRHPSWLPKRQGS